jgi:hypothetical protein
MMRASYLSGFTFLVAVAFFYGGLDAQFTGRWAIMALAVPVYFILFDRSPPLLPFLAGALALSAAGVTIYWTPDRLTGGEELIHLAILFGVFLLGTVEEDLTPAWVGLGAGIAVSAAVAAAQVVGWNFIPQAVPPAGLFINKNLLAEAGAVALVAMISTRMWWLAAPAAFAVGVGQSKAVFGALVLTFAFWLGRIYPKTAGAIAWAVVVGGTWALLTFPSGQVRLDFWQSAIMGMQLLGNGLGSFPINFPFAEFAHSELVQYVYELGILAAIPAVVLLASFCSMYDGERFYETEGLVLVTILSIALLAFPLHMPVTAMAAALCAGSLVRGSTVVRDSKRGGRFSDLQDVRRRYIDEG